MRFICVNTSAGTVRVEDVPQRYAGLGGRGLTSILVNTEVPPKCDPLGPDNKLIFAPGFLTGTPLPNASRISIGAKSPLTRGIKESNVGGTVSTALARWGITAIIVEGQAPRGSLHLLRIDEEGVASLIPAKGHKGMRTYELVAKLLETYGKTNSVLCIGPAGEHRMPIASIQSSDVDGLPCHAAGRGGLGAVMAAKGLKALIVDQSGRSPDPIADPKAFKEAVKQVIKAVKADHMGGTVMPEFGTPSLVAPVNTMGAFPSYNAHKGVLDGWEKISADAMAQMVRERGGRPSHVSCSQCSIHCSHEFVDKEGRSVTGSLEYETIWALGGMTGIVDLDAIAQLNRLCDEIGVDTMSTGVAIAVAMDAGYREFGDAQAALAMVEEIGQGTEFGRILGSGPAAVGRHFHHSHVPVVKGQSMAGYDPRAMLGHGVTYSTSPMGADHTAGNLVGAYLDKVLDPLKPEGQVATSRFLQIAMAAYDTMGQCFMANVAQLSPANFAVFRKLIEAKSGVPLAPDEFPDGLGKRVLRAERDFNRRAGFTKKDDRLPRFFYEEPLPPHDTVFTIPDEELDSVFDF